ncbi:RNA-directed DNA polymerase, eukaryota, reverse transcriptase zinc-binding domain protein [Tanacetum coccineum]
MEGLHVSFQRVVDAGMFKGIMLNNSTCVSHLFYADDAIFMGQWTQANIDIIIRVLKVFHIASGLRINMKKSKLMGLGVDTLRVEHAIQQIGCMALKLPFKYLGSMVGGRMTRTNEWTEVVNAMVNRLSKWKLKTISIGGRLTLLKSVLGSSPIYYMSMYKVPMTVLHNMEVIRARFFNGMDKKSRNELVSWKSGMEVRLLKKYDWLECSLGFMASCMIGKVMASSSSSVWLSIIREVNRLKDKGMDLISFIKPKCGNGTSISFWNSVWRGEVAFKDLVPRLGGVEQMQMEILNQMLDGVILSDSYDRWVWSLEGSGNFSVSSIRKRIDSAFLPRGDMKTRWIKEVPIKVNIHAWKVLNDYLPTRFNLSRRGLEIGSINCPICNCMAESARHLFFSCELVKPDMLSDNKWWDLDYSGITNHANEWECLAAQHSSP